MTIYCLPKDKLSETRPQFLCLLIRKGWNCLMKGRPKKTAIFWGHYDSSNVLLITIFDKISWVTHHSHEVGHQLRTGWKKKKETPAQLNLSRILTEIDGSTSIPSKLAECAVFSYLPFLNHKLGAQMMSLPTCDCLDLGSSEYSNIKYVRKFKVFLKTDQSKSFENSFEQQFNEIWINLLNWANYSSGL